MHGIDWTTPGHALPIFSWIAIVLFTLLAVWMIRTWWKGRKKENR